MAAISCVSPIRVFNGLASLVLDTICTLPLLILSKMMPELTEHWECAGRWLVLSHTVGRRNVALLKHKHHLTCHYTC